MQANNAENKTKTPPPVSPRINSPKFPIPSNPQFNANLNLFNQTNPEQKLSSTASSINILGTDKPTLTQSTNSLTTPRRYRTGGRKLGLPEEVQNNTLSTALLMAAEQKKFHTVRESKNNFDVNTLNSLSKSTSGVPSASDDTSIPNNNNNNNSNSNVKSEEVPAVRARGSTVSSSSSSPSPSPSLSSTLPNNVTNEFKVSSPRMRNESVTPRLQISENKLRQTPLSTRIANLPTPPAPNQHVIRDRSHSDVSLVEISNFINQSIAIPEKNNKSFDANKLARANTEPITAPVTTHSTAKDIAKDKEIEIKQKIIDASNRNKENPFTEQSLKKRSQIINEILQTEQQYFSDLHIITAV